MDNAEHYRVIELCVEQAGGRVPVIAGCGSNDTRTAVAFESVTRPFADAAGRDDLRWLGTRPLAGVTHPPEIATLDRFGSS